MENYNCSSVAPEQAKIDRRRRKIANIKSAIGMFAHGAFWRTLHFTKLARPYSVFMCRNNWYKTFMDGRCQWCGFNHKARVISCE